MTQLATGSVPVVTEAIDAALATVRRNIATFGERYPCDTTDGGHYPLRKAQNGLGEGANSGWTTGFWPGMFWLGWELTGDETFHAAAQAHAIDFERRVRADEDLDHHDLGFLFTLSLVSAWRLTGDEPARGAALAAARRLMHRFLEPAGIIQAWGDLNDPAQRGRTIIDSLMNTPLLTWAAAHTDDEDESQRFTDAVRRHTDQLRRHILREDDSTFHTFYWDAETGEPLRGGTEQGAGDGSCWARGQAWGIYGFALNHRTTRDPELLTASRRCADYFLAHLPEDRVPYWDLVYGDGSEAPRDSSAGAIAVGGLRELAGQLDDEVAAARYRVAADEILASLIENYTPEHPADCDGLLLHGVYDLPKHNGVDEANLWGDYFYLEALARRAQGPSWRPYW